MAKDILRFHCVYWPAMLLSAGYDVPKQIFVHGYLILDGRGISKSLGNVISPRRAHRRLRRRHGALLGACGRSRSARTGRSRSTSIHERYERELGNDLGNLLSRTTAMIARYRDGRITAAPSSEAIRDRAGRPRASGRRAQIDAWDLTGALEDDLEGRPPAQPLRRGDEALGAREGRRQAAPSSTRSLYDLADGLRCVAVALAAFVPRTSRGHPRGAADSRTTSPGRTWRPAGRSEPKDIEPAPPLFPRVDAAAAA